MTYHPDPHGELEWEPLVEIDKPEFSYFERDVDIPKVLATPFLSVIENSLSQSEGRTTVQLLEVYADLILTLPERQVQLALRRASRYYFSKVLAMLGAKDLTGDQHVTETLQPLQEINDFI
ncbi:hypothetical protein Dxin01_00117 [Deinococcus xinjiangensis]|uniref:Uncharacterized protein n=1 Tax=Deinococcus xinjiangensis TaxID=457454 RepID=A0ABP9V6S8_9DEIO